MREVQILVIGITIMVLWFMVFFVIHLLNPL